MENTSSSKFSKLYDWFYVFFPTYFVYLLTVYPTVSTEDSGELATSAITLDIAHPSGYPLHTLLGKLFTILIPFGNMAWRVNLMSAFFGAATVTVLYLLVKRLSKNDTLAICIALLFAFSDITWSQSIRTEVYSLNSFFIILVTYVLCIWHEEQNYKQLWLAAFLYGLSLANSHIMFLAAPPFVIYVLARSFRQAIKSKTIIPVILLFFLGLSVYAYLPIRTSMNPPYDNPAFINHDPLNSWDKFIGFVNRKIYGGTINVSQETNKEIQKDPEIVKIIFDVIDVGLSYWKSMINNSATGLWVYYKNISNDLIFLPYIFFIPGLIYIYKKYKKLLILLLGLFIFYTNFQLIYIGVSEHMIPYNAFSVRPFFIAPILCCSIITAMGVQYVLDLIKNVKYQTYIVYALFLFPFFNLFLNFYNNNESHNYIAYDFNKALLESLPPNSHFITTGRDNFTFPLYYLKKVEHVRPDVDLTVYYGRNAANKEYLDNYLADKNTDHVFLDLLPTNYLNLNLYPYNFVYVYGNHNNLPPEIMKNPVIHGIRRDMDFPNSRLIATYYLKNALHYPENKDQLNYWFDRVLREMPWNEQFVNFIRAYQDKTDSTGMF